MDRRVALSERSRRIRVYARMRARARDCSAAAPATHGLIIRAIVRLKVLSRSCGEFAVQGFRIQAARRGTRKDELTLSSNARDASSSARGIYTRVPLAISLFALRDVAMGCLSRLQMSSAKCFRANSRLSRLRRFLAR